MKLFLSHNKLDKDVVTPIAVRLKNIFGEDNVFFDSWSIKPGEDIVGKMNQGLTDCDVFIVFLSKNSINSEFVKLEWHTALMKYFNNEVRFLTVRLDDSEIPSMLRPFKYIDIYSLNFENGYLELIDTIKDNQTVITNASFNNEFYIGEQINCNEIKLIIKVCRFPLFNQSIAIVHKFNNADLTFDFNESGLFFSNEIKDWELSDNTKWNGHQVTLSRVLSTTTPFSITIKCEKQNIKISDFIVMVKYDESNWKSIQQK